VAPGRGGGGARDFGPRKGTPKIRTAAREVCRRLILTDAPEWEETKRQCRSDLRPFGRRSLRSGYSRPQREESGGKFYVFAGVTHPAWRRAGALKLSCPRGEERRHGRCAAVFSTPALLNGRRRSAGWSGPRAYWEEGPLVLVFPTAIGRRAAGNSVWAACRPGVKGGDIREEERCRR